MKKVSSYLIGTHEGYEIVQVTFADGSVIFRRTAKGAVVPVVPEIILGAPVGTQWHTESTRQPDGSFQPKSI